MAIQKNLSASTNKFDGVVAKLDEEEAAAQKRSEKVVKNLAGGVKTRVVIDKNGRKRTIRVKEKEETKNLPLYLPLSMYNELSEIADEEGINKNILIRQVLSEYFKERRHNGISE